MALFTHWAFMLASPFKLCSWVRVSVSKRLMVLALAAFLSEPPQSTTTRMAGSWARRSASLVSVVASQAAVDGLPEQRNEVVLDVPAGAAFLEVVARRAGQGQGFIQFPEGQEAGVGGDGRALKFQADFGVEMESERGLFGFTHRVPPRVLRYLSISRGSIELL